jgi:signal transduction histidine kinase
MAAELEANQRQNAALLATLEERVAERTRALEQEVRQRQKAQAELQQAQKMEAIGQLTGGIAHDFNNLLTAVLGNLEMSRSSVVDARGQRLIEGAIRAAERGAVLTQRLLAFGRRQHLAPEPLDLPALLEGVRDLLSRSIGPAIRLELSVQPDIWPARADRNQLELAVLNLVLNARDAMPLGGVITIAASNRRAEAGDELQPGDYVVIGVIDTGTGMPVKVAARAFEPFFTTKDAGKGSGLGLSMVQGFAAQSGGKVALRSAPGHGTTVEIWLPRAQAGRLVAEAAASAGAATSDGSGRVLVCDDDADVRELVIESLSEAGYEIAAANGGAAALRLIERGERFDAVIIDFAMPEMDGFAVARAIRRLLPDIPLLLITGYIELGADSPDGLALPILKKPFKPAELAARLAELIRGAPRKVVPLRPRQR